MVLASWYFCHKMRGRMGCFVLVFQSVFSPSLGVSIQRQL
ncbi:hypothetical protein GFS31_24290 [Leptolyngbya sp. BL0902]|nr:hypothetical protein GFS31_24290 [Leptolyngbya sp. BL0902]